MIEIILYGADLCPDCRRAKAYLQENNVEYTFIDVDLDKEATARVEAINNGKRIIPTIIIEGKSYTNPDNVKLASLLGINEEGTLQLFGADWGPDSRRAKSFLRDNGVNFQFIESIGIVGATCSYHTGLSADPFGFPVIMKEAGDAT